MRRLRDKGPTPVSTDEWRQFAGTTINFISENTAPTSAIAANLKPFTDLTGIEVKISQLELTALVQKVALDFASGIGAYDVVYADPYQVLAPYSPALAELNQFNKDPNLPKIQDLDDFIPTQLDAAGRFVDREKIYALPYDAPTLVWMYRKDIFEKHRGRMQDDLGFDPMPSDESTWEQFYEISDWIRENAQDDVPYGSGHQAKQHDSLMNDFSNVLWAYGGDYFDNGPDVGRFGSDDPGEPLLDRPESIEGAEMYRKLVAIAHPASKGWDWTGLAEAFMAGQFAMGVEWHEFAAGIEASTIAGKVGYARLPRGPKRSANMYGGTGIGDQRRRAGGPAEGGLAVRQLGDVARDAAVQPQERGRRRDPDDASRSIACRRSRRRASRRRRSPTCSRRTRCSRHGSRTTSACDRRSRRGTSATRSSSRSCRRCSPGRSPRRSACATPRTASKARSNGPRP